MIPAPEKIARILDVDGPDVLCEKCGHTAHAVVVELTDGTIADGLHYCPLSLTLFESPKTDADVDTSVELTSSEDLSTRG
jgi:hypothetical protein